MSQLDERHIAWFHTGRRAPKLDLGPSEDFRAGSDVLPVCRHSRSENEMLKAEVTDSRLDAIFCRIVIFSKRK